MSVVTVISSSPRKGNSDILCDHFVTGALEVGATVHRFWLGDLACRNTARCVQTDDAQKIIDAMAASDVICFATPVYFYNMSAQLKVLIDRCCAYTARLANKKFVLLLTCEDRDRDAFDEILTAFNGYFRCLDGAETIAVVRGYGVLRKNEILDRPTALEHAYQAGLLC
jgi:multimeric flavodoxin WrbA